MDRPARVARNTPLPLVLPEAGVSVRLPSETERVTLCPERRLPPASLAVTVSWVVTLVLAGRFGGEATRVEVLALTAPMLMLTVWLPVMLPVIVSVAVTLE